MLTNRVYLQLGWRLNILESVAITLAIGLSVDFTLHYAVKFRQAASKGDNGGNMGRVAYAASQTAGPVAMAALTTLLAGMAIPNNNRTLIVFLIGDNRVR